MRPLFITGIGTEVGKTLISSLLVEKLRADYWKPVQSGDLDYSDTDKVKNLVTNTISFFHPESYRLTQPFSPHKSADLDSVRIDPANFILPNSEKLIIEGAGGLMVPLTTEFFIVDLIKQLQADVILVSRNYLGSINHTLMSIDILRTRNISLKGIVFNGDDDEYSEEAIRKYSKVSYFAHIPKLTTINKAVVAELGSEFDKWDL